MNSYLVFFPLVFSLLSCSTSPPEQPVRKEWIVNSRSSDSLEAHQIIEAKKRFLDLTFEQTVDTNFHTEKFQPRCLLENSVGKIEEDDEALFLNSLLMTDKEFRIGHCQIELDVEMAHFVWLYCKSSRKLYEIRCLQKECQDQHWKKLC